MNTEPPTGDDLEQMLVTMKRTVLTRAAEQRTQRPRRGRRAGIVIGIIAVLGIGATSGGVALGMIPQPFAAAPAPSAPAAPVEPSETPTRSSAPVVNEPTSTPTPTRKPFTLDDPTSWTIGFDEVGPVALGAPVAGELDDLDAAYTRETDEFCSNPDVFFFSNGAEQGLVVTAVGGTVFGVTVGGNERPDQPLGTGPTTAEGVGVGSTLAQLRAAYPDLEPLPNTQSYGLPQWTTSDGSRHITFVLADDDGPVKTIWVSTNPNPPYEYCG
ncbi:hypothetical protein [Curtobacterium sp. 9128]|uniref:hypothetical protein n=1 Tax=Curtobacterium sp. 9128 TaxID=1793722 RepID=UPI0011A81314|nr:hypothetical protein [Curtobacterium sp. 9128]